MKASRRKLLSVLPASLLLGGAAMASDKTRKGNENTIKEGSFSTPQSYGIEPGEVVHGDAMAKLISAGGDIRFIKPGVYLTDRTLVIPSMTRLWIGSGVTIKLADNSNCNIFQNQAYYDNADVPDERIEISGLGEIDFNGHKQNTSGLTHMCSILKNIKDLKLGGGVKVLNANKYAWLVAKIDRLTVDGINFDTYSDGLHCQPPINHAYIRNIKGKTGDDMLAFTIGDYANYDISEPGDFSNVDVAGLFCESALCAVKITGNDTGVFDKFRITGIYGNTKHAVFRIWGDTNLLSTKVRSLTVEDIHAMPADGYPVVDIDDRKFASGKYGIEIDSAVFRNVYNSSADDQTIRISSTVGTMIHNLLVDNPPRYSVTVIGLNHVSSTVENLTICNGNTEFPDDVNSCVVLNRGTINRLNIQNYRAIFSSVNTGSIARMIGSCMVNEVNFNGIWQENGVSGWVNINSSMATPTTLNISNYTCSGKGRIAQTLSSILKVKMKNVCVINGSPANKPFYTRGGEIILSGDLDCEYNTIASDNGGVITIASGMHNIFCDVSLLKARDATAVINTNDSLSCGSGMVIAQDNSWRNLSSGATYKNNNKI